MFKQYANIWLFVFIEGEILDSCKEQNSAEILLSDSEKDIILDDIGSSEKRKELKRYNSWIK